MQTCVDEIRQFSLELSHCFWGYPDVFVKWVLKGSIPKHANQGA